LGLPLIIWMPTWPGLREPVVVDLDAVPPPPSPTMIPVPEPELQLVPSNQLPVTRPVFVL
jgi:hypothetical protein